jgi:hypothetical protein
MKRAMRWAAAYLGLLTLAAVSAALGDFWLAAGFGLVSIAALVAHGAALWRAGR